ncbi:histone-lysine N-methyltransferase SUV39H2-like [Watersipora subatra]|uniref:histone-lysine N-methyltransferase SUV39H2-like n=1 Tax=Watersipora subatra TaxID=2589382 RepID=UPI00355B86A2
MECKPCKVAGLYSLVDIQKLCTLSNLKLSSEANDEILYKILKTLGPKLASKAVHKLMDDGYLSKESNEYEVEEILDKTFCTRRACDVYFVKWKHWPDTFNTWEPLCNLEGCEEAVARYAKRAEGGSSTSVSPLKRKQNDLESLFSSDSEDDSDDACQKQLKSLYSKLKNSQSKINPVTLVKLSCIADEKLERLTRKILQPKLSKHVSAWATKKHTKLYREHKMSLQETLKAWETKFNAVNSKCQPVTVENDVDLEAPPENFQFICDYLPMPGLSLNTEAMLGCSCEVKCCAGSKHCCPHNNDSVFAYTSAKRVRLMPGSAIYECNSKCLCDSTCWNRVVQLGSQVKLAIFKTRNGCGWGVKAKQRILKGTFVMEYLGEIITNEEAEKRGKIYDSELFTYLFDLDFDGDDCQFTIDARNYGNISHFVNHSCDPNMSVYGVWINSLDVRLPRIALFANRDIAKGEEVCFDYKMTGDTSEDPNNITGISERTPAKMSPFKSSPYKRRPTISPAFRRPSIATSTVACTASVGDKPSLSLSNSTVHVDTQPVSAKVSLFDKNPTAEPLPLSDADRDFEVMLSINDEQGLSNANQTSEERTSLKVKDPKYEAPLETEGFKMMSDLATSLTSPLSPELPSSLKVEENLPFSPSSLSKSASKPKFSCQNYRIVCHCGAKNCRKFLF